MRNATSRLLTARLQKRCRPLSAEELRKPALVIAPHYDDETLGCGATLALKAQCGASVTVLFVSDGAGSHGEHDNGTSLADQRRDEAIAAVTELGLDPTRIGFGELPDGALADHLDEATMLISGSLDSAGPAQIFVPHRGDGHSDHMAVTTATFAAVAKCAETPDVFEYPVWHWQQWPWVALDPVWRRRHWGPAELHGDAWRRSAGSVFGARFAGSLNVAVDVDDTIELKRRAARCYETQMSREDRSADWATLYDVSGGQFVERLLTGPEYFRATPGSVIDA